MIITGLISRAPQCVSKNLLVSLIKNSYVHRDYFMVSECARFLFTSERDESFNNNTAL